MAANTHAGEEEQIFVSYQLILQKNPNALFILAPYHPDRVDKVLELCHSLNLSAQRYTQNESPSIDALIFFVDLMSQLPKFYRASDLAFVGGSLMLIGGHNIIETASAHTALIVGLQLFNITAIINEFKKEQACEVVNDSYEIAEKVLELLENPSLREALTQAVDMIVQKNSGT